MNNAAIVSRPAVVNGQWRRDNAGRVVAVICDCGASIYFGRKIHSRLVDPHEGVALCKCCKSFVRVPVGFVDDGAIAVTTAQK